MAAPAPEQWRPIAHQVVDLSSDDDDEDDDAGPDIHPASPRLSAALNAYSNSHPILRTPALDHGEPSDQRLRVPRANDIPVQGPSPSGTFVNVEGEMVFIPDEDDLDFSQLDFPSQHNHHVASPSRYAPVMTYDGCLLRVLDIFPNVSHEHVRKLYYEFDDADDYESLPPAARLDHIIEQLASATHYPKQEKGKKRKREESPDGTAKGRWEDKDRLAAPSYVRSSIQAVLKADFPEIPVHYINLTLAEETHLFHAYVTLARIRDTCDNANRPYGKGRPSARHTADADTIASLAPWPTLHDELKAARARVEAVRGEREAAAANRKAEQENLERAITAGETAECSACYETLPMNRQMHCDGLIAHFVCLECMERYIKSEVGDARCQVLCPSGCGAAFAQQQLDLLADKDLLEKLAQLQQEKDIRDAELEDLEECPFCDYKAILPPVDEDFEFRCVNPNCEKVSCRRCKSISHVPVSCEQHAKDNKLNGRHTIEEAMTAALVRSCNKCKKQFIKDFGCNKMTCPSCHNRQCYVCSETVHDYNHFDQNNAGTARAAGSLSKSRPCPLYDNVEERHEREVKEAEATARAKVVEENPDIAAEDLEIKVSDAVKHSNGVRVQPHGERVVAAARRRRHLFAGVQREEARQNARNPPVPDDLAQGAIQGWPRPLFQFGPELLAAQAAANQVPANQAVANQNAAPAAPAAPRGFGDNEFGLGGIFGQDAAAGERAAQANRLPGLVPPNLFGYAGQANGLFAPIQHDVPFHGIPPNAEVLGMAPQLVGHPLGAFENAQPPQPPPAPQPQQRVLPQMPPQPQQQVQQQVQPQVQNPWWNAQQDYRPYMFTDVNAQMLHPAPNDVFGGIFGQAGRNAPDPFAIRQEQPWPQQPNPTVHQRVHQQLQKKLHEKVQQRLQQQAQQQQPLQQQPQQQQQQQHHHHHQQCNCMRHRQPGQPGQPIPPQMGEAGRAERAPPQMPPRRR